MMLSNKTVRVSQLNHQFQEDTTSSMFTVTLRVKMNLNIPFVIFLSIPKYIERDKQVRDQLHSELTTMKKNNEILVRILKSYTEVPHIQELHNEETFNTKE